MKEVNLSEIIEVKKGKYITKKETIEGPYPVILGGREPAYYINKYNHTGKAIVVSRSGASAGYVSFWNEPIFVTDGFLIEPKETVDIDFLYYLMKANESHFLRQQGGAAIPHVTPKIIGNISVILPTPNIQQKIVSILKPYDDLIENNQKQIKLLEEAAQRLYKEWFVDLRFPGHENTEFVDGLPSGWKKQKLSEFGEIVTGKTPSTLKSEYFGGEIPFVKIPDMHNNVFPIKTEITLTEEGANSQKNKYIPKNSIIVSCIATVGLVNISYKQCQTNQQINSIILDKQVYLYYLFFVLKELKELLEGVGSNGATMTNVNKIKFGNLDIIAPLEYLLNKFYNICKPIFDKILKLSLQIENLTEARDRLLPKLMSGEIEV